MLLLPPHPPCAFTGDQIHVQNQEEKLRYHHHISGGDVQTDGM